jgi:hypothetical protein
VFETGIRGDASCVRSISASRRFRLDDDEWNAQASGRRARVALGAPARAASIAAREPDTTVCNGAFTFAITTRLRKQPRAPRAPLRSPPSIRLLARLPPMKRPRASKQQQVVSLMLPPSANDELAFAVTTVTALARRRTTQRGGIQVKSPSAGCATRR